MDKERTKEARSNEREQTLIQEFKEWVDAIFVEALKEKVAKMEKGEFWDNTTAEH